MAVHSVSPRRQASAWDAIDRTRPEQGEFANGDDTAERMPSFAAAWDDARRRLERPARGRPERGESDQNVCGVIAATFGSIGPRMRLITADSTNVHSIDVTM